MKKLLTILVLFVMCGVAMAQGSTGPNLSSGLYKYEKGKYIEIKGKDLRNPYSSPLTMHYTSAGWPTTHIGKAYFTTMSEDNLSKIKDDNGNPMTKVVVQFLGTEIDDSRPELGHEGENITGKVNDYGIYLYDKNATDANNGIGQMYSIKDGNSFALNPGTDFGIYYKTDDGREWYSTANYVGTWDPDQHYINYYDNEGEKILINGGAINPADNELYSEKVDIRYTCAFMTKEFGDHWEFMLETKLDHPYYNVDPKDFGGNGDTFNTNGQPLPGTLATLLIGSLCAAGLRKKNQK